MEQVDRDVALAKFRNGSTRVLLATNVAARGIDIGGLELVVNYDLPTRFDVYAHRVGRTGRAGNTGIAISLVKPLEEPRVQAIAAALGTTISRLDEADPQQPRATGAPVPAAMQTLRIWGGRRDKLRPGDILGALTGEEVGLAGSEIGKIEIHDRVAFVAVRRERGRHAHRALAAGRLKARRFRVDLLD
jgi:ATP-independent RNA helicase DbpA